MRSIAIQPYCLTAFDITKYVKNHEVSGLLLIKGLKIHASPSEGRKHQVLLGRTLKAKLDSWGSMRFDDVPNMGIWNVNSQ